MRLDAMHSFAEELRMMFRITHGVMDAEDAMARELIALNLKMMKKNKLHMKIKLLMKMNIQIFRKNINNNLDYNTIHLIQDFQNFPGG